MEVYTGAPHPLFAGPDSMVLEIEQYYSRYPCVAAHLKSFSTELGVEKDFEWGLYFLGLHNRALGTFNNYRGIVERLLLWSWIFRKKSTLTLNRDEFWEFISFCKTPPEAWVGTAHLVRFVQIDDEWTFNDGWRPFHVQKQRNSDSNRPFSGTLQQIQRICSSFYSFLYAENAVTVNPVVKSRFDSGSLDKSDHPVRNFLSSDQISRIMQVLERRAAGDPAGERALFIVASMIFMCRRTADLANSGGYCPCMDCFVPDEGHWWLVLHKQGSAPHKIKVNSNFLPYLKRYRKSRNLTPLPERDERVPILEAIHGLPGLSIRQICAIARSALRQVYIDIIAAGGRCDQWNLLLKCTPCLLRDSGARDLAQTLNPVELQKMLGSVSLAHTYARYYCD